MTENEMILGIIKRLGKPIIRENSKNPNYIEFNSDSENTDIIIEFDEYGNVISFSCY